MQNADPDRPPRLPPHPTLERYYSTPDRRVAFIGRLFDATASSYDKINTWMSFGTGEEYRLQALKRSGVEPGQDVLDIGCGTGVMARQEMSLVGSDGSVVGIDPSLPMLDVARRRGVANLVAGRAEQIPLADGSVDFISMGHALRHASDLDLVFREFYRVLRPGGTLLMLEIVPPAHPWGRRLVRLYLKRFVPFVTVCITRSRDAHRLMSYYWDTLDQCVPPETILGALRDAGFSDVDIRLQYAMFGDYRATRPV